MSVISELHLVYSIIRWLLYIGFNKIYTALRNIKWRWDAIYDQHQDPDTYERCAHVMTILYKYRLDDWINAKLDDFILAHDRFENPDFIHRDDVSLYAIDSTHAIFVQCSNSVYQKNFFILGQYYGAEKVITMSLKYFNQLAERLEENQTKIIFIHNQGRCGSTLLTSLFKETGRCLCISEPHCYNNVCYNIYTKRLWYGDRAKRIFRNMVRVLCKPYHELDNDVLAYVIKPTALSMPSMELTREAFPESTLFFMYRDPTAMSVSLRRAGEAMNSLKLLYHLPNIPNIVSFLLSLYGHVDINFCHWTCELHAELELGYRTSCMTMYYYLKNLGRGIDIHGVRYLDLINSKSTMTRLILDICGFPEQLSSKAIEALEKDSQKTSPVSRDALKVLMPNPPKVTTEFLQVARKMADEFGVPGPDEWKEESFHLNNSLIP